MFTLIDDVTKELALTALEEAIKAGKDKPATVDAILDAVKDNIASRERMNVYLKVKACPLCAGVTSEPGIVREYFTCKDSWHEIKGLIDKLMTPQIVG